MKNRSFVFFSLLVFFLIGCADKSQVSVPDSILPKEKFTKLLADFLISESATNLNIKNINITKFDSAYAFNPLKENAITKSQYDSTIYFYSKHPDLYKEIYEDVLQLLNEQQTDLKAKTLSDSLQTIKTKALKDSLLSKKQDSLKALQTKKRNAK